MYRFELFISEYNVMYMSNLSVYEGEFQNRLLIACAIIT